MKKGTPLCAVHATCTHATAQALRIDVGDGRPQWIPRATVASHSQVKQAGDTGTLYCTLKIAKQKGWA